MKTVPIKDYEHIYTINEVGEIYNILSNRYLTISIHKGYKIVTLSKNKQSKHLRVHRLLYQAFKGDLIEGLVIDHKDNDTLNNALDNIQQITQRHNTNKDKFRLNPTSKYPGVYKSADRINFRVEITIGKDQHKIGTFKTEEEAYSAYLDVLQNPANKEKYMPIRTSKFKGVYFDKQTQNYRAEITINKKRYRIGRYPTQETAAFAIKQYCSRKALPWTP